jgi:hypothetical protein
LGPIILQISNAVEAAREALAARDELTDEEAEEFEALDAEAAALAEPPAEWSDRQKQRCGAVVSCGRPFHS